MKYKDNMTSEEIAQFMNEINALNEALADADQIAKNANPLPDEWEDEMQTLQRSALDSRGRP